MNSEQNRMTSPAESTDRMNLLKDVVNMSMDAAYGLQKMTDQQIGQILGGLVRSKLLSADDSYKLRDQLLDKELFDKAIDSRIEATLKRRGIIS